VEKVGMWKNAESKRKKQNDAESNRMKEIPLYRASGATCWTGAE
jgi:hypothetical protein